MKKIFSILPLALCSLLFLFDALEWASGVRSPFVLWLWCALAAVASVWVISNFLGWWKTLASSRERWLALMGFGLVLVLLYPTFRYFSEPYILHTEAAQQGECAYRRYSVPELRDTLMYSWCFLGYNTRQYVFQALLTDHLGPGALALNLPYVFHFVLGLFSFWIALEKLVARGIGNRLLLWTALILPTQSYFYFFLSNAYEQSFFPYCHTLLGVALFIECALGFSVAKLGVFMIALVWLLFSYTPALGVYFFLLGMFVLWVWKVKPFEKRDFGLGALFGVWGLAEFALSLDYRTDIRLFPDPKFKSFTFMEGMEKIIPSVFSTTLSDTDTYTSAYVIWISVLAFVLMLTVKRYRWAAVLAFLWAIAQILISGYSKGYAAPLLPFSLHRAIPVFPILGLFLIFGFGILKTKWNEKIFFALTLIVFFLHAGVGTLRAQSFFRELSLSASYRFSSGRALVPIWKSIHEKGEGPDFGAVVLGSLFRTETPLGQFTDATRYFFPGAKVTKTTFPTEPIEPGISPELPALFIGASNEAEELMKKLLLEPGRNPREVYRGSPAGLGTEIVAFTYRYP